MKQWYYSETIETKMSTTTTVWLTGVTGRSSLCVRFCRVRFARFARKAFGSWKRERRTTGSNHCLVNYIKRRVTVAVDRCVRGKTDNPRNGIVWHSVWSFEAIDVSNSIEWRWYWRGFSQQFATPTVHSELSNDVNTRKRITILTVGSSSSYAD